MRRLLYSGLLLAAVMAISGVKLTAQDSLGDVARRIRAAKGEDAPSVTDKPTADKPATDSTAAEPRTLPTTAELNAIAVLLAE